MTNYSYACTCPKKNLQDLLQDIWHDLEMYDRHGSVICKMAVENMQNFSEQELERVFGETCGPELCKKLALEVKEKYDL